MMERTDEEIRFGILTVSDRCAQGLAEDTSGPNLKTLVENSEGPSGSVEVMKIVPDELNQIKNILVEWSDGLGLDVVLTTGGTGFARRDVTPEATRAVIDREANGISVAMLTGSLKITPLAMLGRPVCGIRKRTLIINLPGSKKGAQENFLIVRPWMRHAVNHLREDRHAVGADHTSMHGIGSQKHACPSSHSSETVEHVGKVARRPRKSPYPLTSFDDALKVIGEHSTCLSAEIIPITDALGRIISEDVVANISIPPFDASIKDGYAVLSSDGPGPRKVISSSLAGRSAPATVQAGTVVRISTGAMVPPGADAIVQVEDTELITEAPEGNEELEVKILTTATMGQDIRPAGSDVHKGDTILRGGVRLGPSGIGLLASVGVTRIAVFRVPTVAVLSTGNELCDPHGTLGEGQIYDSNRTTLKMALEEHGIPYVDMGIAKDSLEDLQGRLSEALSSADVVITSGGVSMGEKDLLKHCLTNQLKGTIHFGRVLLKPGKPTTFATIPTETTEKLVFALPGNPVSSIVCFNLFVLPALRRMKGDPSPQSTKIKAKLTTDIKLDSRPEFQRVQLTWKGGNLPEAHTTGNQMSCRLLSMCQANALLQLPPKSDEVTTLKAGDVVDAIIISTL